MNTDHLARFLSRANERVRASGARRAVPSRTGSHDCRWDEWEWTYHDSYYGNRCFLGGETVYEKNAPVWGMNYYGSVEKKTVAPEEIYAFLRKALSAAKPDLVPLRGPTRYVEGEWEYDNVLAGPLTRFEGRETIRRAGTLVYASTYHGGAIE